MSQPYRVGFLLWPGLTQLDMTGPAQVLSRMPGAEMRSPRCTASNLDTIELGETDLFLSAPIYPEVRPRGRGRVGGGGVARTHAFVRARVPI
jgi:hypothetical protein